MPYDRLLSTLSFKSDVYGERVNSSQAESKDLPTEVEVSRGAPTFHSIAFSLLGIDYLPLPKTNWHLKEGDEGFNDPYLTDKDYQTLCNIVCQNVPGVTVRDWRESTQAQKASLMEAALSKIKERQLRAEWSTGKVLASAKEICRRLRVWHIDDYLSPIQFCSERESRRWVRLTFREIIAKPRSDSRPGKGVQLFPNANSLPDDEGSIGEAYENPDRVTDRSLTMWHLGDFYKRIELLERSTARDYLVEVFGQLLDLPAWRVRGPEEGEVWPGDSSEALGNDARNLMVTGRSVPLDLIACLDDAAEKLFLTDTNAAVSLRKAIDNTSASATDSLPKPNRHPLKPLDIEFTGAMKDSGAYGEVFPGRQIALNRDVAIKIINQEAMLDAVSHAIGLARVNHPNVVTVYEVGLVEHPDRKTPVECLVMEWFDGQKICDVWTQLQPADLQTIFNQILSGIRAMHLEGVCHHDLHAGNVMVRGNQVKIIDIKYTESARLSRLSTSTQIFLFEEDCSGIARIIRSTLWHCCGKNVDPTFEDLLFRAKTLDELETIIKKLPNI